MEKQRFTIDQFRSIRSLLRKKVHGCCTRLFHEFCTYYAIYLCSTRATSSVGRGPVPPGSINYATSLEGPFDLQWARVSPQGPTFRSLSCKRFYSVRSPGLCMGGSETSNCLVSRAAGQQGSLEDRCLRLPGFGRSTSQNESRRWLCSFSQAMGSDGNGCRGVLGLVFD
ncbi:Unknown protein [Striga hermonthica]|uniref:Uncharacterized protein n=1 Tax=Striga hermonthica TaxID=68872 RepID=A0A9N7RIR4_STRHE|nr:Unknown protein [Striga hermonthica]